MSTDLLTAILARVADMAGLDASKVTASATLESLGLDSSDAVVLAMEAEELIGREVDVGLFLRCATIGEAIAEAVQAGPPDIK